MGKGKKSVQIVEDMNLIRGNYKMNNKIIDIYEKYLDRIWDDLSRDDQIRLEGHFNGIINEIDEYLEEE